MKKQIWFSVAAIAVFLAGVISAADESVFAKANQAYSEARFQEAADGYESLVQSGQWNANLFYDLGNAYYRLGNFDEAVKQLIRFVTYFKDRPRDQHEGLGCIRKPEILIGQGFEGGARHNVYLDSASVARARKLGKGNISEGIRIALSRT